MGEAPLPKDWACDLAVTIAGDLLASGAPDRDLQVVAARLRVLRSDGVLEGIQVAGNEIGAALTKPEDK